MIGALRHRITLMNPARVPNGRGGWQLDYQKGDRMEVWADASVTTVAERLRFMELKEEAEIEFVIRENPFVNKDTRILFNGTIFRVITFAPHTDNDNFFSIPSREV